jgi:carbonic anhydrase/acetyltransferase-like protein (isoleucine patch superfamily)
MGAPAKVKRSLTESDRASIADYAKRYVEYKNIYREEAASE